MLLAVAVTGYAMGLGGQYVPTNGDELVYVHIARLTAESGHWLPLVSDLDHMRNTKPPLLFWQAMVAGGWGSHWSMATLRLPSLIYTLLLTAAVAWSAWLITRDRNRALLAACLYLAFFSTFRYGRPYLTSAAESFWLDLPLFALLAWHTQPFGWKKRPLALTEYAQSAIYSVATRSPVTIWFWLAAALVWGLGSLYKSFALIVPAAGALWLALGLLQRPWHWRGWLLVSLKAGLAALLAVAVFSLWFVLDPDPAAVWQEFVVGENVGKMGDKLGWWHEAIFGGGSSLWAQLLAYVENAGLLAFVVLGLGVAAWRGLASHRRQWRLAGQGKALPPGPLFLAPHVILLAWLLVWLLVFALPSQRSARYVIPAMPALAIVLALAWDRIGRGWFVASLALVGIALVAFMRIAWVAHGLHIATDLEFWLTAWVATAACGVLVAGLARPAWTRACLLAACLLFYLVFGLTTQPLDGPAGRYSADAARQLAGQRIAVPSNFNAQYERFEFLLPSQPGTSGHLTPFDMADIYTGEPARARLAALLASHDAVVWLQANAAESTPPCAEACEVLAQRWIIRERHRSGDITWANLWQPGQWLFSREWLLRRSDASKPAAHGAKG